MSIKSLKLAGFKEFFKRLYAEHKLHKTLKSLAPLFPNSSHSPAMWASTGLPCPDFATPAGDVFAPPW